MKFKNVRLGQIVIYKGNKELCEVIGFCRTTGIVIFEEFTGRIWYGTAKDITYKGVEDAIGSQFFIESEAAWSEQVFNKIKGEEE